jgi:hypothetical protein
VSSTCLRKGQHPSRILMRRTDGGKRPSLSGDTGLKMLAPLESNSGFGGDIVRWPCRGILDRLWHRCGFTERLFGRLMTCDGLDRPRAQCNPRRRLGYQAQYRQLLLDSETDGLVPQSKVDSVVAADDAGSSGGTSSPDLAVPRLCASRD